MAIHPGDKENPSRKKINSVADLGLMGKPGKVKSCFYPEAEREAVSFHIISDQGKTLSATQETLKIGEFGQGYVYVITSISARQETAGTPRIELAIGKRQMSGTDKIIVEASTVGNAGDTVNAVGEFYITEDDEIYADFFGANTSNKLHLYAHGYKIKL